MQFPEKIGQITGCCPPPLRLGNPGSATGDCLVLLCGLIEFFTINDLAVSARSGRSQWKLYLFVFADTWYLKRHVQSRTLLLFNVTVYISTLSKNDNLYLPDLEESAK